MCAMTEKLRMKRASIQNVALGPTAALARLEGDISLRVRRSDVLGAGPNQPVVRVLLEHVRRPAGDAADGENGGEQVDRDAERVIRRGRIEIDVRIQVLFSFDERLDALRHLEPDGLPRALTEIAGHPAQVRGAGIFGVIDTMSEPGDLLLARELRAYGLFR